MTPEECARHLEETSAMPRDEAGGVIPCEECVEAVAHLRRLAALEVLIGAGRQEVMALVAENARLREAVDTAFNAMHSSQYVGGLSEREAWQVAMGALSAVATQHQSEALGEVMDPAREALERRREEVGDA